MDWLVNKNTEKQHSEDLSANLLFLIPPFAEPKTDNAIAFGVPKRLEKTLNTGLAFGKNGQVIENELAVLYYAVPD